MTSEPITIAVVMAAYNAEATLPEAVASVLASTVPVHLFIVDDASRIPVVDALKERMGVVPENVTILRSEVNTGPAGARNLAMRRIIREGYTYAAVLDADDLTHPERFAKQAAFLDANSRVAAVGTWANAVHEKTLALVSAESYPPVLPADVSRSMCINSSIINTSVMFRVSALQDVGLWDETLYTAEDYDLFCRLSRHHDLANIPEYLVDFRLSSSGMSLTGIDAQRRVRLRVQLRHFPHRVRYWQAWLGIIKTLLLLVTPNNAIQSVKMRVRRYKSTRHQRAHRL